MNRECSWNSSENTLNLFLNAAWSPFTLAKRHLIFCPVFVKHSLSVLHGTQGLYALAISLFIVSFVLGDEKWNYKVQGLQVIFAIQSILEMGLALMLVTFVIWDSLKLCSLFLLFAITNKMLSLMSNKRIWEADIHNKNEHEKSSTSRYIVSSVFRM